MPQAGSITLVYETGWDTAFLHYNPDGKGGEPQAGSITLVYETGWDTAFLHYNADGKGGGDQVGVCLRVCARG